LCVWPRDKSGWWCGVQRLTHREHSIWKILVRQVDRIVCVLCCAVCNMEDQCVVWILVFRFGWLCLLLRMVVCGSDMCVSVICVSLVV